MLPSLWCPILVCDIYGTEFGYPIVEATTGIVAPAVAAVTGPLIQGYCVCCTYCIGCVCMVCGTCCVFAGVPETTGGEGVAVDSFLACFEVLPPLDAAARRFLPRDVRERVATLDTDSCVSVEFESEVVAGEKEEMAFKPV